MAKRNPSSKRSEEWCRHISESKKAALLAKGWQPGQVAIVSERFRQWTDDDIRFLVEHNDTMTAREIGEVLGRTEGAVHTKRNSLGLKSNPRVKNRAISAQKRGALNPNWKGDSVPKHRGNERCRYLYEQSGPCEVCGEANAERHHKDGNPLNNAPGNIAFLCRRHHMEADGRLAQLSARNSAGKGKPRIRRETT